MGKQLLVVEDEQDHRELLRLIFNVHGYDVSTAGDALEAARQIEARRPDLIILDVMLPDMDGWTFCEQVKHNTASQDVPIMMLSASAHMQPRFEGSCADAMMTKPFDEKELLAKVRYLVGD
jgi:DNA-binding response OmpR family regulator